MANEIKRLIVIDGNPIMYRAYHTRNSKDLRTSTGRMSGGFYHFLRTYLTLRKRFESSHFIFCFDSGRSWRNDFFPTYKTHAEDVKPTAFLRQLEDVIEFLVHIGVPVYMESMLEADDLISVFTCGWTQRPGNYHAVVVSSDRDFFQLVSGQVMVFDDRAKKFYGPAEVEEITGTSYKNFLYYKCLIGDVSDKIPGVLGIGPVKARKMCNLGGNIDLTLQLNKEDIKIFQRNMELIKLPRKISELRAHTSIKNKLKRELDAVKNTFVYVDSPYGDISKKLLDLYECKSFTIEDFING